MITLNKKFLSLALSAVCLAASPALLSPNALAQAISVNGGSIQGTITDASGADLAGASITILGTDTGFKRALTTDKAGFYSVGPLNPGNYSVTVTAPGFQTLSVQTVIRTGTATPGSFKLSVGQSSTEISVQAGAVQVNTDQIAVSDVITKQQIDSLPINGRNFLDLAQIEPGVILQSGETFDPTKAGYSAISTSGVSGRTTRILLDGQDITDETVGTTIFNVSQGAISEFQLNRSTQDVAGEVTSTGQVLVSTNSGTNGFHGQLFYNFQDHRALFARTKNGLDVPFQRNQFGGGIGGPIIKDKLFFFGNVERIKQDSSGATSVTPAFASIAAAYPAIPSPYRETYSTIRLDYNGPFGGHYFVRANYNVNSVASNFGDGYWLYANRDNTPGLAGGADFATGRFTHSFRVSYEKFHNLIADKTSGNSSIYNGIPGFAFYNSAQGLYSGPNYLAPQGTFQSDKQVRYDGSWSKGSHSIRYGYSFNRILGGGFASFFGLSPRASETSATAFTGPTATSPNALGCGGVAGAASCISDPINGYHIRTLYLGNGQGYFTEKSGFNLPGGGVGDYRQAAYVSDNWKITPSFTLVAGVRWSVDTDRANQDLTLPTCNDVDTSSVTSPCTGTGSLLAQWNPSLTGSHVHQSYGNFGPQMGFNYAPGDHKTVFSGGIGIYYEGDVFNNTTNARTGLLKKGAFFDDKGLCAGFGVYSATFPDGSIHTTSPNGSSINALCNTTSIKNAAPQLIALQQSYQANTAANSQLSNGGYIGETLVGDGLYGTPYRTPYSEQYNFGIQRELFKGAVIKANYVHNSTLKIGQEVDQNHIGAARFYNATAAANAVAATAGSYKACATAVTTAAQVSCAISQGAQITDFANNGLDSGNQLFGGTPASYNGFTAATGAAFPGANPLLGHGGFIMPIGRSGYDALQVVFTQVATHPLPGVMSSNVQVSYNLSRIMSNGTNGGSDQFFSSTAIDNDNPNLFMGRNSLDHTNQLNFGGSAVLKYGPKVGFIGHFYSASASTLALDSTSGLGGATAGGIFQSDITGDGTVGDVAPGTSVGGYMHGIKANTLQQYITGFNASRAGKVTPAGQALINANLFTYSQLVAANGVVQPIANTASGSAIPNPAFRSLDVNFSYPIRFNKIYEGMSLEPSIVFYNVANLSNFGVGSSGTLLNLNSTAGSATNQTTGYLSGPNTYAVQNAYRSQRGSGTFDQGAPRSTEFQLKLNF
jgi:hypothetical protein